MLAPTASNHVQSPPEESGAGNTPAPPTFLIIFAGIIIPAVLAYFLTTTKEERTVAAVLAALGGLVIIARPFWGLILFVGLLYTRPEESIPALSGMRLPLMISLVTMAGLFLQLTLQRQAFTRSSLNGMVLGFGLWGVVTTFNLGNTGPAAQDMARLVILVVLILNLVSTPERYQALVTALIVFTAYLSLYSIYRYFTGGAMVYQGMARSQATGIFSDPNDLAATFVAGLGLCVSRVVQGHRSARILYGLLAGAILYAILLTNSRGGMLALLCVGAGCCVVFVRRKGVAVILACLVCVILLVLGSGRMTTFDSDESSANSRFWFWSTGIKTFMANPVTGCGYGQFSEVNGGMTAHNSFVLCFAELGLPGYFFWIGCIYYAFQGRVGRRGKNMEPDPNQHHLLGARLALVGFLTACFWISRTYVPVMYILITLPVVAQIALAPAADGKATPNGALVASENSPTIRLWRDRGFILLLCVSSILLISAMAETMK